MTHTVHLSLQRVYQCARGTAGIITIKPDAEFVCFAAELPWAGNAGGLSRIPPGEYALGRRDWWSERRRRFLSTLHVLDVPGRGDVAIHEGGTQASIRGIVPALSVRVQDGAVRANGAWDAYRLVEAAVPEAGGPHRISIRDGEGLDTW